MLQAVCGTIERNELSNKLSQLSYRIDWFDNKTFFTGSNLLIYLAAYVPVFFPTSFCVCPFILLFRWIVIYQVDSVINSLKGQKLILKQLFAFLWNDKNNESQSLEDASLMFLHCYK